MPGTPSAALFGWVNASVLTMDPARPRAEALALADGRIATVGSSAEVRRLVGDPGRLRDLGGRAVLPGFIDAHNHFSLTTAGQGWVDCRTPPLTSIPEIQARLAEAATRAAPGDWVRGFGYHHQLLAERRHPTRWELDEAVPDRPVILVHFSHHQAVAGSRALALAGIGRGTPDPPGGEIARDKRGEPAGLLFETAMAGPEAASREAAEADFAAHLEANTRRYAAVGLTGVHDAAVSPAMAARYREAAGAGALRLSVLMMAVGRQGWFAPPLDALDGDRSGGPRLEGGVLKVFVDGGYRCALRYTREGVPVTTGFLFFTPETLTGLLDRALELGWRVTCHALGNRGVEVCLEAMEAASVRHPGGEARLRLDHAMFLTPSLIRRVKALGIPLVVQPSFVYDLGDLLQPGPPGLQVLPFRSLLEAGIPLAFSSDSPCGSLPPLVGIYAAVTRRTCSGRTLGPEEAIGVEAALRAYTLEAALAGGATEVGSIAPGKRADLVVLSADPTRVPAETLLDLRVEETVVEGQSLSF